MQITWQGLEVALSAFAPVQVDVKN
jgi:hypothetical protein